MKHGNWTVHKEEKPPGPGWYYVYIREYDSWNRAMEPGDQYTISCMLWRGSALGFCEQTRRTGEDREVLLWQHIDVPDIVDIEVLKTLGYSAGTVTR